jgi:hypothetical protein
MSEAGNDDLLAESGALEEIERQRAREVEADRAEEQRSADAAPVDDS